MLKKQFMKNKFNTNFFQTSVFLLHTGESFESLGSPISIKPLLKPSDIY